MFSSKPRRVRTSLSAACAKLVESLETRAMFSAVTFLPAVQMPTGALPYQVASADFDGDGKGDVVSANVGGSSLSVELSHDISVTTGVGASYNPIYTTALPFRPIAVTAADYDGDGKADAVVIGQTSSTTVGGQLTGVNKAYFLHGLGNGRFASPQALPAGANPVIQANSLATGDFNGDGLPDLAVYDSGDGSVRIYNGALIGLLRPAEYQTGGSGGARLGVGDFDGDHRLDVIAVGENANVTILANAGNGLLLPAVHPSTGLDRVGPFAVGDLDGDGRSDLVVGDYGTGVYTLLTRGGTNTSGGGGGTGFTFVEGNDFDYPAAVSSIGVGDFNNDGKADIAVAIPSTNSVGVQLGNGDGSLATPQIYKTGTGPNSLIVGDFNGDGAADIATADLRSNDIGFLYNRVSHLTPYGLNFATVAGTPLTNLTVGYFIDTLSGLGAGSYSASINWGDGTTSVGTIVAANATTYRVLGTHTYASPGTFAVHITVTPSSGPATTINDTATIAPRSTAVPVPKKDAATTTPTLNKVLV